MGCGFLLGGVVRIRFGWQIELTAILELTVDARGSWAGLEPITNRFQLLHMPVQFVKQGIELASLSQGLGYLATILFQQLRATFSSRCVIGTHADDPSDLVKRESIALELQDAQQVDEICIGVVALSTIRAALGLQESQGFVIADGTDCDVGLPGQLTDPIRRICQLDSPVVLGEHFFGGLEDNPYQVFDLLDVGAGECKPEIGVFDGYGADTVGIQQVQA